MLTKLSVPPLGVLVPKPGNTIAMALMAAGFSWSGWAYAEVIPVSSRIGQVTVFSDRALVNRGGQQAVPAGEHELVFKDLPYWLEQRSLRFNAKGKESVRILDISSRDDFQANSQHERIAELDRQIKEIESQLTQLEDQGKILLNKSNYLEAYQKGSVQQGKDTPRLSTTQLLEIMNFSKEILAQTYTEQRELDKKTAQWQAELAALQEKRGQIPQENTVRSKTVVVQLEAPVADKLDVSLSYVVPAATWWPNYDASYDSASNTLELSYYAQISQQTGEDWNNVKLVLSTAQPMIGAVLPELDPWLVDIRLPRPERPAPVAMVQRKALQAMQGQQRNFEPMAGATMELAQADASFNTAIIESGLTNTVFNIEKPASIPTGPEDKKVAISVTEFKAEQTYQLVPALQEGVFLTVKAANSNDYPLLPGNLNAFLDGQLIASSNIKTVFPAEPLELAMGTDESISVKREPLKRFTESTGLTGSGKRISYEYQTVIQNNRDQAVELVLHDRFPLSRNEKIDIRRISPSDKEITLKNDGRYEQLIKLAPKEKKTVVQKFSVAYPNEVEVTGLP